MAFSNSSERVWIQPTVLRRIIPIGTVITDNMIPVSEARSGPESRFRSRKRDHLWPELGSFGADESSLY